VAVIRLTQTPAVADDVCRDCGDELRASDDVLCRWCEDNRALHPDDYEVPVTEPRPEAVAS
jgi:hypothetical protein